MRIFVNDFGGYPFPSQLSHQLAARKHDIRHAYCDSLAGTPTGTYAETETHLKATFFPIHLKQIQQKSSLFKRRAQDIEYGKLAVASIEQFNPDVVISANTPLNAQSIILDHCQRNQIPFIYWLQDLISVAISSILSKKLPVFGNLVGQHYQRLERRLLQQSQHVIAISDGFLDKLRDWKVNRDQITIIENWAPIDQFPRLERNNDWAQRNGLVGKFVYMYSGTLSLKHDPQLLVNLALATRDRGHIVLIRTQGEAAQWVREQAKVHSLSNLIVQPFGPLEETAHAFASADVLVAILEPEASHFSVPSKVLSYLCAGRPVLLAVPENNLAARIVTQNHAGIVADPRSPEVFVESAIKLADDASLRASMGNNARHYAENHFDINKIADIFEQLVARVK